jgi:hypothetical protein
MKLIITTPDAIYDWENNDYFPGIIEALIYFKSLSDDYDVVVISNHPESLEIVPDDIHQMDLSDVKWIRKSPKLINHISKQIEIDFEDIIVLGAKQDDMILAANARILLLTADYAKKNNPTDRIYTGGYGIGIMSVERLRYFFDHYLQIETPWFFSYSVNETHSVYGLTNAMTRMMRDNNEVEICDHLRNHLKEGYEQGKFPFRVYSLLSMYRIFREVMDIDYWGYYPSSDGSHNEALHSIKEILRKSFGSRATKDILIRHTASPKRNRLSSGTRVADGCNSQFDTIHLNPWYRGKIEGKNFCIIDDFSTHGTSSETVRHLLEKEGANKIVFVSLGKFKYTYKEYNYTIDGDVFTPDYTYTKNGTHDEIRGTINPNYSDELMDSLRDAFYE